MRQSLCDVWIHAVWGTWDRQPLLVERIIGQVHAAIGAKCREMGCPPVAIGGVADHVHLLVGLSATVPVARLIQEVKGSTSHLVTHRLGRQGLFKWQGAYAAFSVSKSSLESVREYVLRQPEHHARSQIHEVWEMPREIEHPEWRT